MIERNGWIKLQRNIMSKSIWQLSTPEQKTILITLLLLANSEPNEWEFDGHTFNCNAGQFVTSLNSIAEYCGKGISVQNVRTALKRFENLGFLKCHSIKTGRVITINNWKEYQFEIKKRGSKQYGLGYHTGLQDKEKEIMDAIKDKVEEVIREKELREE